MATVISTLTDSVNVSPVNWRQGSLTQRVAELALGGGGSSSTGSQTASTGIVRGFDVYPDADTVRTIRLLTSQGTLDSLVVFTDAGSGATLQYRTFTGIPVTLASGDLFVAFRPDFERRVIELVSYTESEYEDGDVEDDGAVIVAWVKSSGMIPRTGIQYAGQTAGGVFYQRGQVYSPDLVERVVFDFRDGDPVPFEISGSKVLSITNGTLQVTGATTGIINIPVYQYMLPDNRDVAFPDTASKIRAVVRYTGNETNIEDSSLYFTLSDGSTTAVTSSDYPAGNADFGTTEFTRAVEIIPEQGGGRPNWAYLTLRFANTTTLAEITEIVLEIDRVNPALSMGTAMVLGQALYQGATDADFVRVDSGGVLVTTSSASTTVSAEGVTVTEGTVSAFLRERGLDLEDTSVQKTLVLNVTNGVFYDNAATGDSIEISTTAFIATSAGELGRLRSDGVLIQSASGSGALTANTLTHTAGTTTSVFGDLNDVPSAPNAFGAYVANSATGEVSYLVEDGMLTTNGVTLSSVTPDGVLTTSPVGFSGVNAPVLIATMEIKLGVWSVFSQYSKWGTASVVSGDSIGFILEVSGVGANLTQAFASTSISGSVVSVAFPAANRVSTDFSVALPNDSRVYLVAFDI